MANLGFDAPARALTLPTKSPTSKAMATITHINPDTLHRNPAFSQAVAADGASRLVFVGGQNGVDTDGRIVGPDLDSQARQAFANLLEVLKASGATQQHVVKLSISIVQGQDVRAAFGAAQAIWGPHPTAIGVSLVAGLANPQFLIEIEAVAAIS